ncbi:sigma-70 family RNA polymerase sigma factor [Aeromicrobium sp. zg-636]|uniref:Sigma-70 family RNA polymerase sigma factor n=1 Tax=Aeromicrobium senzhongii TaxID=2663859 RepID=A0A8I0ETE5_9ACTN|nr:sigma-70 family RNA polymerase sigma factor [Aeromicrobium sp. 636]MBC9225057.1 sigma-70 family RNA polymerase sigma factor [Aeromicrobium senzhongii]
MEHSMREPGGHESLVNQIGRGSEPAFDALYAGTAPAVARFAWSLTGTRDAAEELLQETFLTAWRKHGSIQLVNGSALPWLLVTCRNHARNHVRREIRQRELLERHDQSVAADPINGEAATQLRAALDSIRSLPEVDRLLCEWCLLQGYSYREAAQRLAISEASVGKRLHRSRQQIRRDSH